MTTPATPGMHPRRRPLKVAVLCSRRAPGLVQLLHQDPQRGHEYEIVCCISSAGSFDEEVRVERRGVPCLPHPVRAFCAARGGTLRDLTLRADYDAATRALLEPYQPDILLLDGYLLLLTEPVLEAYEGRIVNVHHGDLALRHEDGSPRYPGLRAVRDAILGGEPETRATAHIVTPVLDDGPMLLRSWRFPVPPAATWAREHDASDVLRASIWAHQEWMLRSAWAAMLSNAIAIAAVAFEGPGRPIDPGRAGCWRLEPDGRRVPDPAPALDASIAVDLGEAAEVGA